MCSRIALLLRLGASEIEVQDFGENFCVTVPITTSRGALAAHLSTRLVSEQFECALGLWSIDDYPRVYRMTRAGLIIACPDNLKALVDWERNA